MNKDRTRISNSKTHLHIANDEDIFFLVAGRYGEEIRVS